MKILIVDDSKKFRSELRSEMKKELSHESLEILEASNVSEAINKMEDNQDIDVIILDYDLGGLYSGLDFMKDRTWASRPRIMIVTAFPKEISAEDVLDVYYPVDFFLIKEVPFKLICHAALMMAKGRQSTFHYTDEDIFGQMFCREIDQKCLNLAEKLDGNPKNLVNLIQSCARTFWISHGRSTEDLFQYVVSFNEAASLVTNMPDKFVNLLKKFPDVERALYKIPEYRDHLIHQMQVFLLGFCILSEIKETMTDNIGVLDLLRLHDASWIQKWFLTSGFHDIGYPFEKMNNWLDSFFKDMLIQDTSNIELGNVPCIFNWGAIFSWGEHLKHFNMLFEKICEVFQADNHQKNIIRREMARRIVVSPDHALVSALVILNLIESEAALDAAVAVCLHDIEVAGMIRDILARPLSFREAPLACLLAFCDTAQEWGRLKPIGMPQITSTFGSPRFLSLRCENNTILLDLKYPKAFSRDLQNAWEQYIHKDVLFRVQQCWNAERMFHITYYFTDNQGRSVRLGTLEI
jgi:DNA-binding NarL/FixJ family response regulator